MKNLTHEIVELFENLLDEKGIEVPCENETEQKDRYDGKNTARLYGSEYWDLVDKIGNLLSNAPCRVCTSMGGAEGNISVNEDGELIVTSDQLNTYLEENSME